MRQLQSHLHWAGLRLVAPVILLLWFGVPILKALHATWWLNYDYSHGYLILALTVFLVAVELRRGSMAPFVPSWAGFACVVLFVLATLVATSTSTESVAQLTFLLSVIAAVWAIAGWYNARRFALPIAYLLVAVPVWSFLIEPMRRLTVSVVSQWIRLADLPAYIEGNLIHVPTGTFEVLGGCSGLRYSLVALALAIFAGLHYHRRWAPSLLLIAVALALAQFGNWLRVFITVAVGMSPSGPVTLFVHDEHTLFGWVLFAVFMLPLVYLNRVLLPEAAPETAATVPAARISGSSGRDAVLYAACVAFAAGIWVNHRIDRIEREPSNPVTLSTPSVAGWNLAMEWQDQHLPFFAGANGQAGAWYDDGAARVGAYIATYADQGKDNDVAAETNQPAGPAGVIVARRTQTVETPAGLLPFEELEVTAPGDERSRLVWVGLRVGGRATASRTVAKFLQLPGLMGGRRDAQVLILTALCDTDCNEAHSQLLRFATAGAQAAYLEAERSLLGQQYTNDDDRFASP